MNSWLTGLGIGEGVKTLSVVKTAGLGKHVHSG